MAPDAEFDDTEFIVMHPNSSVHLEALLTRKDGLRQEPDIVSAERAVDVPDK